MLSALARLRIFPKRLPRTPAIWLSLALLFAAGCGRTGSATHPVVEYTYRVVDARPHDPQAFTQGLLFHDGFFYESTGLNGRSTLRKVDPATGEVLKKLNLPAEYFGEGLALLGNRLYQLTWRSGKGFVYDLASFTPVREFAFSGEGWGLTTDGRSLILSDGTAQLRFLDPDSFAVTRTVTVTHEGYPVTQLNELEYIDGEIFANLWQSSRIVRIAPESGRVTGIIDLTNLLPANDRRPDTDVLNGIAYDPATRRLFVTGKNWPRLFEIELIKK